MTDLKTLSDGELVELYADWIESSKGTDRARAQQLAQQLIDALISHGDNPRSSEEEAKRNINVIVTKWLR
jgi:hypothetical protein